MQFDYINGVMITYAKNYEVLGNYEIYGRISYAVPKDLFANITGSLQSSNELYFYLIKLSYLDVEGFITDNFDFDL